MSRILIDFQYVKLVSSRLEGFHAVRHMLFNCRCPICGDSQKKKNKMRFFIYQNHKDGTKDYLSTACHNCGYSQPFGKFLEEFDTTLYAEYRMDLFKEMGWGRKNSDTPAPAESPPEKPETIKVDGIDLPTIADLPEDHHCKQYVKSRALPVWTYDYLMYAENFAESFRTFSDETILMYENKKLPRDERLIIPFYDEWGSLKVIQGRALGKSALRYISLKRNEKDKKVFGLDRLNKSKPILVVEGPIDSMMLPNCIATADADLLSAGIGDIFIPDAQYRNTEICDRIVRMIAEGKRVVLFPKSFAYKDINEAIVKGGMSRKQIIELIVTNTFSGLAAVLQLSQLRKDLPNDKKIFRRRN